MTDDERLWNRLKLKDREYADDIVDIINCYNEGRKLYFGRKGVTRIYNRGAIKYILYWLKEGYTYDDFQRVFMYKYKEAKRLGYSYSIESFLRYEKFETNLQKAEEHLDVEKYTKYIANKITATFINNNLPTFIRGNEDAFRNKVEDIVRSGGDAVPSDRAIERVIRWMKEKWEPQMISPLTMVKSPEKFREYLLKSKMHFKKKQQQTIV